MIKPPLPPDESERLRALLELNVLDTDDEVNFDELVEMASKVCETPIALISLVDKNRQWFKAKIGLSANETHRDISFCGHAIHSTDLFIVSDPQNDERFQDNPLVTGDLHIRFYAGAPLITSDWHAVGTLCVIDHKEKELTDDQKKFLKILSKQVVSQLEMRKNFRELQALSTKLIEQQKMLQEQEKLAVIGKLASSVSHELNNPLAIIGGTVHLLKSMIKNGEAPEKIEEYLDRIDSTVMRVGRVGGVLKSLSSREIQAYPDAESLQIAFTALLVQAKKAK
jgi:signal transduction histidine kinase